MNTRHPKSNNELGNMRSPVQAKIQAGGEVGRAAMLAGLLWLAGCQSASPDLKVIHPDRLDRPIPLNAVIMPLECTAPTPSANATFGGVDNKLKGELDQKVRDYISQRGLFQASGQAGAFVRDQSMPQVSIQAKVTRWDMDVNTGDVLLTGFTAVGFFGVPSHVYAELGFEVSVFDEKGRLICRKEYPPGKKTYRMTIYDVPTIGGLIAFKEVDNAIRTCMGQIESDRERIVADAGGAPAAVAAATQTPAPVTGLHPAGSPEEIAHEFAQSTRRRSMPGAAVTTASSKDNPALVEATRKVIHKPSDSLRERLAEINTLKYAFIDPNTRRVRFIGTYDPAYASGPIPYADLLAEALDHPYPAFSLDEGPSRPAVQAIKQLFDKEMQHIATDQAYGIKWMQNILLPILHSKEPIPEKLVLDQHFKQLGIEPQELAAYFDVQKQNAVFTSEEQYRLVRHFYGKLFASVGIEERYGNAAELFMWIRTMLLNGEREKLKASGQLWELGELLGITEEMRRLNDARASSRQIFGLFWVSLLKGMGVPASQVDAMFRRVDFNSPRWDDELSAAADARGRALVAQALIQNIFKRFVLTQAFLNRIYSLPTVYSGVKLYGMRADSPLTRVMFDADYALKYVTTLNPDTAALPGYLSTVEFLSAAAERLGRSDELKEGYVRYWVHPGELMLEPFTNNSGVRFASATVRISVEPLDDASKKKAWLRPVLNDYASILNERYDDYARLYPSLHVMRETEKVIALARWIKQNNLQVDVPKARPVVNPVPDLVEGFVNIIYVRKATGATDDIFVCPSGGVVFDQNEGDGWIKTQPSVTATRDVLQQLTASTALAEKAAEAALGGDLENARDLAEKSAEAMTGQLDLTRLPAAMYVPEPTRVDAAVPAATRAAVSQESIGALDRNLKALVEARRQAAAAEGLRATAPDEYQRAVAAARNLQQRSEDNLQRLQYYLTLYRVRPGKLPLPTMMLDLRGLDPSKPPVATAEPNAGIKGLLDVEAKLVEIRKRIKDAEAKKNDAAVALKGVEARAATAKPEDKQEADKEIAEAKALLQSAEDELAKAKQSETDLTKEEEQKVDDEEKRISDQVNWGAADTKPPENAPAPVPPEEEKKP